MREFRKVNELIKIYDTLPYELARDLVFDTFVIETNYPNDRHARVVLLEPSEDIKSFKSLNFPSFFTPEIDEEIVCSNEERYRKLVYILSDDGSGVVILKRH